MCVSVSQLCQPGREVSSADNCYGMTARARPSFSRLCRLDEWVERAGADVMGLEVLARCLRAGGVRRRVNEEGAVAHYQSGRSEQECARKIQRVGSLTD